MIINKNEVSSDMVLASSNVSNNKILQVQLEMQSAEPSMSIVLYLSQENQCLMLKG